MKEYFQQAVISAGGAYNVPVADGRMVIYANMDLLRQVGINEWPTGWDAFLDMCEKLKSAGITPISMAGAHGSTITHAFVSGIVGLRLWKNDPADFPRIMAVDKTYQFNNPVVVKALEDIQLLADKGYFQEGFMGTGANDAMTLISTGDAAMFIQGTWYSGQILDAATSDIQVQMLPFADDGSINVYQSNTEDGWAVHANLSETDMEIALAMFDFFNLEGYHHVQHLRKFISVMKEPQCDLILFDTTRALIEACTPENEMPHITVGWNSAVAQELSVLISAMLSDQATPQETADSWQMYVDSYR